MQANTENVFDNCVSRSRLYDVLLRLTKHDVGKDKKNFYVNIVSFSLLEYSYIFLQEMGDLILRQ